MTRPRLLLLEDDPAVRRFVEMALEDLELDVLPCATLAQARALLAQETVALVLTDMTLPDGTGLELLQWLAEQGMACRTMVFSGAVHAALRQQLQALGVSQVLAKPVSVASLHAAVTAALADFAAEPVLACVPAAEMEEAVQRYFGGNEALYVHYRSTCLGQLEQDAQAGDRAAVDGNTAELHRMAHNLKSVLTLLGAREAAELARQAEACAAQGDGGGAHAAWEALARTVRAYVAQHH